MATSTIIVSRDEEGETITKLQLCSRSPDRKLSHTIEVGDAHFILTRKSCRGRRKRPPECRYFCISWNGVEASPSSTPRDGTNRRPVAPHRHTKDECGIESTRENDERMNVHYLDFYHQVQRRGYHVHIWRRHFRHSDATRAACYAAVNSTTA